MLNRRAALLAVGLLLGGIVLLFLQSEPEPIPEAEEPVTVPDVALSADITLIGTSVEGRSIEAYTVGAGETDILFIGGIHGGYEWNTILLAEEMIEYFRENPTAIPENITAHIVPNLNPDGTVTVLGTSTLRNTDTAAAPTGIAAGRFNANGVDLNRNFDCRWSESAVWRGNPVGTGSGPFSEPESVAIRDYIEQISPTAVVVWHSRAGNVYGAECGGAVSPETLALMNTYATAAGYGAVPVFDAYVVQGAIEDWLAGQGIPTVSVEFDTRDSSEFEKNLAGTLATLELYRE